MVISHKQVTLAGTHIRLEHPSRGPVHVYQRVGSTATAGFCVYVHGWRIDAKTAEWYVDQQWAAHQLQRKFIGSASTATFVVPAARSGRGDDIPWPDLGELLAFVGTYLGGNEGPVHAIAHSNAYVNVYRWLDHPDLYHVTLLDALYGYVNEFIEFARRPRSFFDLAVSANGQLPHRNARIMVARVGAHSTATSLASPLGPDRFVYAPIAGMSHMAWVTTSEAVTRFIARNERIRAAARTPNA